MTAFCFDTERLERALERWPEVAPPEHARLLRATVRDFLHSDAAAKLRVQPSPPSGDATEHVVERLPRAMP